MRGFWWQQLTVEQVKEQAEGMDLKEVEATLAELKGEIASVSSKVQDRSLAPEARSKARSAMLIMTSIRRHLSAIVARSHEDRRINGDIQKEAELANVERALDAGDTAQAVRLLVKALRGAWKLD